MSFKKQIGFTLIECIFAISLFGLLLSWGTQFAAHWYQKQLLLSEKNRLIALLNFARNQSLIRDHTIMVCPRHAMGNDNDCQTQAEWRGNLWVVDTNHPATTLLDFPEIDQRIKVNFISFQKNKGVLLNYKLLHAASSGRFELVLGRYRCRVLLNRVGRVRNETSE